MNWDDISPGMNVLCASPGSGKSYLIKWLIYNLWKRKKFNYGVVFCPTAHNGSYDWMPKNVFEAFITKKVKAAKDEPADLRNKELDTIIQYQKHNITSKAFIIFDDCIGSIPFNSSQMSNFITTYRHYRITCFIVTQYIFKIPRVIHECAKYAFIFDQKQKRSIDGIHEIYFGDIEKPVLIQWFKEYTKDHQFILVKVAESDTNKRYTVMKAGEMPSFKLDF